MAKFTIEWLSQSFYNNEEETALESTVDGHTEERTSRYGPVSPNSNCGYTSASEGSDAGEDSEGEAGRRVRTKFSTEQIGRLESAFSRHRYLGASQRRRIAENLRLSETQVKTWFQNRRMKLKREVQDMSTEFLAVSASLLPPVRLQHHALGGQLRSVSGGAYLLQAPQRPTVMPHHQYLHHHSYHPYPLLHQVVPAFY